MPSQTSPLALKRMQKMTFEAGVSNLNCVPRIAKHSFTIIFFKYFFGATCPFWLSLLFSFFFCHQVVHLIHLVFRSSWELNPRPRTMAQTVSPWRSPLDQVASPYNKKFTMSFFQQFFTQNIDLELYASRLRVFQFVVFCICFHFHYEQKDVWMVL